MPSYVITGVSRGIGLEFIRQLSTNPDNVVFGILRNKSRAKDALDLESTRPNLHLLQADITDYAALKNAADEVSKVLNGRPLDYLINNAALIEESRNALAIDAYPDEQVLEDDILFSVKTNAVGPIHTINAFLPLLRATAAHSLARVITVSSGMADTDLVSQHQVTMAVPYAISKAALNMAVAKYAARFKGDNYVFLAISPGLVNTSTRPPTPEELEAYKEMTSRFKSAYPDWTGPITPEVSVKMMLKVIANVEPKDSGAFVSHYGNKQWL